ncbi:conserved hypothetical protein [Talaromyces stipitatus ATCC 10500]|uniref:Hyphal anastamosis-8 protein n=1 Tax=Talaromyces stipitatus (strain ATCC 10500 / CBS 375.48 / QM 6759 / NRRL 1006) TaxID=441959 RepID=B8LZG4_TALSN|nr:uncharacterized protein TSTA_089540 [Talaromyces stipitatus ATCC 10500]EED21717.1 conserved hypothetical protein [Talaromyces stipitatus ATCC 10500]
MSNQQNPISIMRSSSRSSSSSSASDFKSPRTARFAEATTVISPIDPSEGARSPFADPPASTMKEAQHHVSDVGFGYVADNDPSRYASYPPMTPASPLKSALKTPGTARTLNPFSPTFREEVKLEKEEVKTARENKRDLKIKVRVRAAKVLLRTVNFSCSLIVLSLLSTSLTIFRATKDLPPRSNLPPWAVGTNPWPQYLLLVMACVSLASALLVFYGYWKGGHRRAEKVAVWYSVFSVGFFTFSTIMWVVGAAIFQSSKANGNGKDLWGWACNDNLRHQLFADQVNYSLVCRLQDWSLVCAIIEIVLEVIVISIYAVVFYRFYTKQRLKKTMDVRDKARSDLYLAQLRVQSAPNTPGFFPMTPKSPYVSMAAAQQYHHDVYSAAENGESYAVQYATPKSPTRAVTKPFQLQPPPIRVQNPTPKVAQQGFGGVPIASQSSTPDNSNEEDLSEKVNEHVGAAPGEKTYDAVPIPGAYAGPLTSPSYPPPPGQGHGFD